MYTNFLNISKPQSQDYVELYSSNDIKIIRKFISDLQVLKKEEIHYFGSSYGVPTLKFKTFENGSFKYYKQIPIKEMKTTIESYQTLFSKHILLECNVIKGSSLKNLVDYLDTNEYKYYPFNKDITYEEPYYKVSLTFSASEQPNAVSQAKNFYKKYCMDQKINNYIIGIPSGMRGWDKNGNNIYYSTLEIQTDSYDVCDNISFNAKEIGNQAFISDYMKINMFIENAFFNDREYENLYYEVISFDK